MNTIFNAHSRTYSLPILFSCLGAGVEVPDANVGLFNPEATPNSAVVRPLLLYIIPVLILDLGLG